MCDVCAGIAEGGTADGLNITKNAFDDAFKVIDAMFDSIVRVDPRTRTLPFTHTYTCPVCKENTREYATVVGYCY